MRNSETSENNPLANNIPKEKDNLKGKQKIDSWIDDIIKQHKKRKYIFCYLLISSEYY